MRAIGIAVALTGLLLITPSTEAKSRFLWEGGFWGGKWVEDHFADMPGFGGSRGGGDRTRTEYHREHRMFASSRACEAWLYRMRTEWQDMPRYSWCKRVNASG